MSCFSEVHDDFFFEFIEDFCSDRYTHDYIFTVRTCAVAAHAVVAFFSFEMLGIAEVNERVQIFDAFDDDIHVRREHTSNVDLRLDITSFAPGRLLIGLGAGGDAAEHQALGIPYGSSGERLDQLADSVAIFRAMLEGDPAARVTRAAPSGRVALGGAASSPRPNERVPLYVAGDHPESIRLAATEGDGWIAPVTTFAAGITRLREEERRSGRAAGSVSAVALQELGRDESLAETPFGSNPDAWLAEQRAAGADEVIITVRSARDVAALSAMMKA